MDIRVLLTAVLFAAVLVNCDPILNDHGSSFSSLVKREVLENRHPVYDAATNLYLTTRDLNKDKENILISPFAIRTINALIYLASRGNL